MTTVPSVNGGLTDRVPTLRNFETLGGSIVKIETSMAELKIAANFGGLIRTFPDFLRTFVGYGKICSCNIAHSWS